MTPGADDAWPGHAPGATPAPPRRRPDLPTGLGALRSVVRTGITPVLLLALAVLLAVVLRARLGDRSAA